MKSISIIRLALVIAIAMFIIFGGVIVHRTVAAAGPTQERYYTSIRISDGDSLWSIASQYHDSSVSINSYVDDLMDMNNIKNDRGLKPGAYITVWYYK